MVASVVLFSLGEEENAAVPLLLAAVFSALVGLFGFRASVITGLRRFNRDHFKVSRKMGIHLSSGEKYIYFEKKSQWMFLGLEREVAFDLHGLVFKKAFLIAFTARAFRYQRISSGLPWTEISRPRLKGFPRSLVLWVEFKVGRTCKRVRLCDKGVSKLGVLPWLMVWCCAPQAISYRFWRTSKEGLNAGHYDEEMFCAQFTRIRRDRK